jgi:hypothetical protein
VKKFVLLAGAALVMAACSESTTAPTASKMAPSSAKFDDELFCESGYVIAYDENGVPYCVPVDGGTELGGGLRISAPQLQPSTVKPTRPKA